MAQSAEALKVRARLELEKLHKGLVVELDKQSAVKPPPQDERTRDVVDVINVPQAIQLVQETLGTLKDLRDLSARQQKTIGDYENDKNQLSLDLSSAQLKNDELNTEIAGLRVANQELQKTLDENNAERRTMFEHKEKVEENLRLLVELIYTSFRDKSGAIATVPQEKAG